MKKIKKSIILLLTLAMIFSTIGVSYADINGVKYQGANGITASKISNPELGEGEVDGLVQYDGQNVLVSDDNTINDRGQNYAWSALGYGDDIYVGTCFGAIYQTLRIIAMENNIDYSLMKKGIDVLYNGDLYNGDDDKANTQNRSVLVKINVKTGKTTVVHGPTISGGYRAAIEFHDKLYFAVAGAQPYILEVNPVNDKTQIVCYSEKPQSASISTGIRGLAVYKNQLVATMIGNSGAYMVASKNPSEGQSTFKVICTQKDLLDYPAYHYMDSIFGGSIWDIVEYNDKLYITVVTGKNGNKQAFALFSGQPDATGKWKFDLIVGNPNDGAKYPYGLGSDRSGAANLVVHNGYLYIGGYNDPMIALPDVLNMEFENLYKDLSSPVCLWRLDENENIKMVAGEANEVFPEGPIGNMGAGFGSNLNQYVWRMISYNGKLYLGTFDIGGLAYPLMQFTNGDVLKMSKEDWEKQINYIKVFIEAIKEESGKEESSEDTEVKEDQSEENGKEDSVVDTEDKEESSEDANEEESSTDTEVKEQSLVVTKAKPVNVNVKSDENVEVVDNLSDMTEIMTNMSDLFEYSEKEQVATYNSQSNREEFYKMLSKLVKEYEAVKDQLPENITEQLDEVLNQDSVDNFKYFIEVCAYLSKGERGFDLLVSSDGANFSTITTNGFGDVYNHGCRTFAVTDKGLCIGTANPYYGCQVWKLDESIQDAVLLDKKGVYDKNVNSEQHKVFVRINFNGNTIDKIECNYEALTEGVDYTVTEDGVEFTEEFLSKLNVGEDYNFTFYFNVGARGRYDLEVIDTTSENEDKDNGKDDNVDKDNKDDNVDNGKDDNVDKDNQDKEEPETGDSSNLLLYGALMIGSIFAGSVYLKSRKEN